MSEKTKVLVLGGCGFIGRNLVTSLVENEHVEEIRVIDKTPPQMAWLNKEHSKAFEDPKVNFCSANLINSASCKNAFTPPEEGRWDIVVNCAAETRPNQSEAVYKEGIYQLSVNCAKNANDIGAHYIELSSGNMSSNEKVPMKEDDKIDAWTMLSKYKAKVEEELSKMSSLKYTVLRLPIVYGRGDKRGLMPRIIIASLYKYLSETMKLLWNESLKLNTVHVSDVVSAIWELSRKPIVDKQVFNIVDDSNSTQGSISEILADIFCIKVDYWGIVMSNFTKANISDTISEINDKHMGPWAEVCQKDDIQNTPLTPYMDEELLYHKHLHLDNTKLKATGYQLRVPLIDSELVTEIVKDYADQNLFPRSLLM